MHKKQCIIRISQLHRIRIWTDSWNLRDYDTRKAFLYQLIERKPVQGNNAKITRIILDYTKYWTQKYWIIQKKRILKILAANYWSHNNVILICLCYLLFAACNCMLYDICFSPLQCHVFYLAAWSMKMRYRLC